MNTCDDGSSVAAGRIRHGRAAGHPRRTTSQAQRTSVTVSALYAPLAVMYHPTKCPLVHNKWQYHCWAVPRDGSRSFALRAVSTARLSTEAEGH